MKNDKKSLLHSYIYENENEEDDEDLLIEVDNIKDDVDVEEKKDVIEKDDNENKNKFSNERDDTDTISVIDGDMNIDISDSIPIGPDGKYDMSKFTPILINKKGEI